MRAKYRAAKSYIVIRLTLPQALAAIRALNWTLLSTPIWAGGRTLRRIREVSERISAALSAHHQRRDLG